MSASGEPELPPSASETAVLCPKCQARNDPALARCSVCGADLLPGRRGRKRLGYWVLGILFAAGVMALAAVLPQVSQQMAARATPRGSRPVGATPEAPPAATSSAPLLFHQNVFSFSYPAGWWEMTPAEVTVLLKTSLKGMTPGEYSYIGGVYTEGLDNCKGCAQIVLVVAMDPALTGTLTDEQYQALRKASEQALGARLLSHRRVEVASMPAVESIHLGLSADVKLWEYIIVPPQPGVAYLFSCSSHQDSFADFEPAFRQAVDTLRIGQAMPTSAPTLTPRSIRAATPRPAQSPIPQTYTVQPGDTLSQIAKNLGLTMDALAAANGIDDPDLIQPGQVLTVPLGAR